MKILMPIDGSEISGHTIDWACKFLSKENTTIDLLTILTDPMTAEYQLEDAMAALDRARAKLEGCGLNVEQSNYMTGDPVERICQYAEDENVDQIVMGSHGRTGMRKMLLGSVSEGVLEKSPRAVFIYRHMQGKPAATH